ncbi:MAG: hypothetical protein M1821_000227 [Bathelium mastoideum]|nr:MAG: hypothetical protein M1821_000227 [Bathelium mastoideum]
MNPHKKQINKQSWDYIMRSGAAGGFAACAAKTVVGPLDRVKILFQASSPQFAKYTGSWFGVVKAMRDIQAQEGARGLFRGHSATLLRIFPYAAIKFAAYEQIRAIVIQNKSQETAFRRFISGSMAGCLSVLCTYPLEIVRVRLAFETKRDSRSSLSRICRQIYHEHPPSVTRGPAQLNTSSVAAAAASTANAASVVFEKVTPRSGLANFFRGFTPTLWGMLPYAGASFLTHDSAGDLMRHPRIAKHTTLPHSANRSQDPNKPPQLVAWAELATGGLAGLVSQTVSYPLEVIRRRMQVGGVVGDGHRLGMAEVAGKIWVEKGVRGFFVGLGIGYVKVIPMVATSFYVYERGKYWFGI